MRRESWSARSKGSLADQAGLRDGMVIERINKHAVNTPEEFRDAMKNGSLSRELSSMFVLLPVPVDGHPQRMTRTGRLPLNGRDAYLSRPFAFENTKSPHCESVRPNRFVIASAKALPYGPQPTPPGRLYPPFKQADDLAATILVSALDDKTSQFAEVLALRAPANHRIGPVGVEAGTDKKSVRLGTSRACSSILRTAHETRAAQFQMQRQIEDVAQSFRFPSP